LISGASYSPRIYNGVSGDDSSNVPIYGRLLDAVGTSGICRTGFKSGNSCGWTLDDLNASFCDADGCTQYLNAYHGGIAPAAGDSGGPIYQPYNGGALLSGTIVGLSCFFVYCTYYGEKVGTILGRWDLTLVCSGTCQIH
ncbi:MAG: hypothetical protein QFC55_06085, partial [Chloroflexota bacterium]|nr:hypothetical protein [Chloroflexota bacterium]